MTDDGIEVRVRYWVLPCWVCERMAKHGALHLFGQALLRDATIHRIGGPGSRPLCERGVR